MPINSIAQLVPELAVVEERVRSELSHASGRIPIWFRGQTDAGKSLLPTLSTHNFSPALEEALLNRFKQNAGSFLDPVPGDDDEWAWMFLMRHYRAPSRLLDWTESALIGLYFAVQRPRGGESVDGALWALLPSVLNQLAHNDANPPDPADLPRFGAPGTPLENYRIRRVAGNQEQPVSPAAGIGGRNSVRMTAQQGVFTVFHADLRPLESWHNGQHVWRYVIPAESKVEIQEELRRLGVNVLSVFPELESVAMLARQMLDG